MTDSTLSEQDLKELGLYIWCPDCGEFLAGGPEWLEICPHCDWPSPDCVVGEENEST